MYKVTAKLGCVQISSRSYPLIMNEGWLVLKRRFSDALAVLWCQIHSEYILTQVAL